MEEKLLLIKYQDNFADNLSVYANAKIIAKKNNLKCCYENTTKTRKTFEEQMACFNLKCNYISQNRAKNICKKISNKTRKINYNCIIDNTHLILDDIFNTSQEIITDFQIKNTDFILNYDLLEEIETQNSIGLYINKDSKIDFDFIKKATIRLNKYIKKPKLYIFTNNKDINQIDINMEYKIINLDNQKEEFFLLKACKHKITHNDNLSFSKGFWATFLNQKDYFYNIYDKKIKLKSKKRNWIAV